MGNSAPHRARKRFGQHFLTDAGVIDAIMRAVHPAAEDIGGGAGSGREANRRDQLANTPASLDRGLEAVAYAHEAAVSLPKHMQWEKPQGKRDPIVIEKTSQFGLGS